MEDGEMQSGRRWPRAGLGVSPKQSFAGKVREPETASPTGGTPALPEQLTEINGTRQSASLPLPRKRKMPDINVRLLSGI